MQSIPFIAWCLAHLNYWVIALLMAIESSFIPFPSEIVVPPAAYMSAENGELNIFLIVLCATLGACVGALINYYLAYYLGRPIIYKFANSRIGHMCLINQEKVEKAEQYFVDHGAVGTLFGRLVPVVRQLISIPAGLAKMNFLKFTIYTALGALIWNSILASIGYGIATQVPYSGLNQAIEENTAILKVAMGALGVAVVAYLIYQGRKQK